VVRRVEYGHVQLGQGEGEDLRVLTDPLAGWIVVMTGDGMCRTVDSTHHELQLSGPGVPASR
jgi:hypothetical protein